MILAKVPIIDGTMDISYEHLVEGHNRPDAGYVMLKDNVPIRDSWQLLSEAEYLAGIGAGELSTDKTTMLADGVDEATVAIDSLADTVDVFNSDGGKITAVVIDPITHLGELKVSASTPGEIRLRAGNETRLGLNEVMIIAG